MLEEDIKDIVEEVYPQLQILAGERKIELNLEKNIFISSKSKSNKASYIKSCSKCYTTY